MIQSQCANGHATHARQSDQPFAVPTKMFPTHITAWMEQADNLAAVWIDPATFAPLKLLQWKQANARLSEVVWPPCDWR